MTRHRVPGGGSAQVESAQLPGYTRLHEPELRFGGGPDARHIHPLLGLLRHGPFSRDKIAALSDPIRVAVIAPAGGARRVAGLLREMELRHRPKERVHYRPEFPGFSKVFGVRLVRASAPGTEIELSADLSREIVASPRPYMVLAEALTRALRALRNVRHQFDVVLMLLARDWESAFVGAGDEASFDLHDYLKAYAAADGLCVQMLKETSALDYFCRCGVMWRLGIALYTKAGGTPWVLADMPDRTAYIGIDYAMREDAGPAARYAICCSQVFDAEGSGLEFVAYEAHDVQMFGRNPFLRRDQMLKVIARSLRIYQRKHSGMAPRRVVVHKNTEFKPEEVDGCFDALQHADDIELVHVQQSSGWRGVLFDRDGKPHGYPCRRGTALQLGPYETLLWTQGNFPEVANGKDFYKEGKGIPEPLMLVRYAGQGLSSDLCREVLALSKMDWNNDGPYDRLPVTLNFAQTLAKIVARMPRLEPHSYPIRLFM